MTDDQGDAGGSAPPDRAVEPVDDDVADRLRVALRAAREAGRATLEPFRRGAAVERKDDGTPVTRADRDAERILREAVEEAFPDDGVLGEEFPEREGGSGFRWIVDPIDGTRSFVRGVPLYGTLVAVERDGRVEAGVIRLPALEESVYAARGGGAWHHRPGADPVPAAVSSRRELSDGLFLTTELESWDRRDAGDACRRLRERAALARTWGDCYGYVLVATGRAEAMVDPFMSLWDAAALLPVVEEAGGTFTDWAGRARPDGGEGVATNGRTADEVLSVLRRHADGP